MPFTFIEQEIWFTFFEKIFLDKFSRMLIFVLLSIRFKISSVLPSVHLKLSDEKFQKLMKVRKLSENFSAFVRLAVDLLLCFRIICITTINTEQKCFHSS